MYSVIEKKNKKAVGSKGISQNSLSSWHLMFLLEMLQKIKSKTENAYGMDLKGSGLVAELHFKSLSGRTNSSI